MAIRVTFCCNFLCRAIVEVCGETGPDGSVNQFVAYGWGDELSTFCFVQLFALYGVMCMFSSQHFGILTQTCRTTTSCANFPSLTNSSTSLLNCNTSQLARGKPS